MVENILKNFVDIKIPNEEKPRIEIPEIKDIDVKDINLEDLDKPISEYEPVYLNDTNNETNAKKDLTTEEKIKIKEETGWSDEIIDSIGSMEEYEIYKNANLKEVEINGKKCLVRTDIDWDAKDEFGKTNRERVKEGKAPIGKDGKPIELHHIGQKSDSPLAELTQQEHRGKGNDTILHDKTKESEIDRNDFAKEKSNHWKARAEGE